ncbi:restriction endonuclease subunit S [Persicitalea sp.]|uniref:restriction endonuclease subunit S n=1 Tax=Persicitalea sp. TaxID=3100273 RepID=UPI003593F855
MSWEVVKMGSFLKARKDRFKPDDPQISELKRISKIDFSGNIFLSDKTSNTGMILVKKGDLVISGINVEKGAMSVYQGNDDIIATIHYSAYEYDKDKIDIGFLKSFLKSSEFKNALKEQVPGGIKTEIKPKHILPLKVLIPTELSEQREIVESLNGKNQNINSLATELTHQLDLVKQLRQAFLREAMQGQLVPQDATDEPARQLLARIQAEKARLVKEKKIKKSKPLPPISEEEIPFEIPESWVWCRLGEVAIHIFDGPFGSHLKTADYTASGVQVIRLENLGSMSFNFHKETFISQEKYQTIEQHTVYNGDVIIGSFLADGVKCVVLPELDYTAIAKADCFTIRSDYDFTSNKYLMYLLSSDSMFKELSSLLRGMTRQRINTTQLKNLPIPLPPLAEQQRIVEKLDELMATCDALEASIGGSQRHNEQLLQQVLREALEPEEVA